MRVCRRIWCRLRSWPDGVSASEPTRESSFHTHPGHHHSSGWACAAAMVFWNSLRQMAQTRSLPRICIALGLPDVPRLLDHARREAEAGETFLEFRLDFLDRPCKGAE